MFTLEHHLRYTAWASKALVDAAANLTSEDLTRDFSTADKSVLGTLVHVYAADRIWLSRVMGNPLASFIGPEDYSLDVLQTEWPKLHERWLAFLAGLGGQAMQVMVAYKNLKGDPHEQPLWQILLHLVNHGTHHRGQVSGFLRAMGHGPPVLDLIHYYRLMGS